MNKAKLFDLGLDLKNAYVVVASNNNFAIIFAWTDGRKLNRKLSCFNRVDKV